MTCFHPVTMYINNNSDRLCASWQYYQEKKPSFTQRPNRIKIEVPCGHCLGCLLDRANMWATRIALECQNWDDDSNFFITLTYNNKHLPTDKIGRPELRKKDLQDFMKRLRYYKPGKLYTLKENGEMVKEIKYFACGEYGNNGTKRCHFHLAIMNLNIPDLKQYKYDAENNYWQYKSAWLQKIWGKGFVLIERLNYKSACYVARYVQKKAGGKPEHREKSGEWWRTLEKDERNGNLFWKTHYKYLPKPKYDYPDCRLKEFITMSKGIAKENWLNNMDKYKRNGGIYLKINDKVVLKPLPRYFIKMWEKSKDWEKCYEYKYKRQKIAEEKKLYILSNIDMPNLTDDEKWTKYLLTKEKLLQRKATALKRNDL